mmetsp:Transcript_22615/g.65095  ORF Transcript_22615/g.65095 Transcript_22615/m.65095 type:complete len:218 (-) Transcript_22615:230-883(-)
MKMMLRPPLLLSLAISKRFLTNRSLSPCHLLMRSAELTEKNVLSDSVATALANRDFPVPGGPNNNIPLKGRLSPVKSCGNFTGIITASFKDSLAPSRPATSSHFTFGFSETTTLSSAPLNFLSSSLNSSSLSVSSSSSFLSSSAFPLPLPLPFSFRSSFPPPAGDAPPFFCGDLPPVWSLSSSARFSHPSHRSISKFFRDSFLSYLMAIATLPTPSW